MAECSIIGCGKQAEKRTFCGMHYRRWHRHGDPHFVERVRHCGTPEERFWAKVDTRGPCWEWQGAGLRTGYGTYKPDQETTVYVHRYAYQLLVGEIPEGLELDHLCRNRRCVNPDHLEPVTRRENVRRGVGPAMLSWRQRGN